MQARLSPHIVLHAGFATVTTAVRFFYQRITRPDQLDFKSTDYSPTIREKRNRVLIHQAFYSLGWRNPIYVKYGDVDSIKAFTAWDKNHRKAAYISIPNEHRTNYANILNPTKELELYALMGREAVHLLNHDLFIREIIKGYALYFSAYACILAAKKTHITKLWPIPVNAFFELSLPWQGIYFLVGAPHIYLYGSIMAATYTIVGVFSAAISPFIYLQERQANIKSAKTLGTASVLQDHYKYDLFKHSYLQKLPSFAHTPTFFKSQQFRNLPSLPDNSNDQVLAADESNTHGIIDP